MKKIISLLLALALCLGLCACGGDTPNAVDSNDANNELIKEWEEVLFNNVWYGRLHGNGNRDVEFVFYPDGSYARDGERNETWVFIDFYEDGAEFMAVAAAWQTTPDYDLERGLYIANDFTLGITKDGEYVLRVDEDFICYTQSQNQDN